MSGKNQDRRDSIERYNRMIEIETGRAVRPFRKDGYVNMINKYGTNKDVTEYYRYQGEPEFPDLLLTQYYESNGLFSKIIDTPAEEAVKHGFDLVGVKDEALLDFCEEALDELDWDETAMTAIKWTRLYGGAIAVLLINDGRGLEEPLDWKSIKSIDDIRVFDRAAIMPEYSSMYLYDPRDPFRTRSSRLGMPERYYVSGRHGNFVVHESRCLVFRNGIMPENTTSSNYELWGVPEYTRIHRAIRDAEIAHGSAPKLLQQSVQPIYKMRDLSRELETDDGEDFLLKRLNAIDLARGAMNSIAIDSEGEDYHFETFTFSGINDALAASCNMLSAVTNIPQTILFGQPVGGLSTTDDTAMENYYNYIEHIQRRMLKSNLRYLLSVVFQAGVSTGEIDEVPKIRIKFKPLWSMTEAEEVALEQQKVAIQQTRATTAAAYVDMGVLDPKEVRKALASSGEFDIETMLDEREEEGMVIPESLSYLSPEDQRKAYEEYGPKKEGETQAGGQIFEQGQFNKYGVGVNLAEHNRDPGTEGSAPTAAPAATKLPQDMSEQEKLRAAKEGPEDAENKDSEENEQVSSENKTAAVGVLCVENGAFLMAQRKAGHGQGLLGGPGGHVEAGETAEQAAYRETEEEFGIKPKDLIFIGNGPKEPETGYEPAVFLCTEWEGEPKVNDGEMGKPMWITPEMFEQLRPSMFPPTADGVDLLLRKLHHADSESAEAVDAAWTEYKQSRSDDVFFAGELTNELPEKETEYPGDDGVLRRIFEALKKLFDFGGERDIVNEDGGPGSGFPDHSGRPGMRGGSLPRGASSSSEMGEEPKEAPTEQAPKADLVEQALREIPDANRPYVTSFKRDGETIDVTEDATIRVYRSSQRVTMLKGQITRVSDFAGGKTGVELDVEDKLIERYGGKPGEWAHTAGDGEVMLKNGKVKKVEIHWFERPPGLQTGWKLKYWNVRNNRK